MKQVVSLILVLVVAVSCSENESAPGENFVSVKRNGQTWTGAARIYLDDTKDTLVIEGISDPANTEVVGMRIKFNGIGTYPLEKQQGYYYTTIGGDVLTTTYKLNPAASGVLVISDYNPKKKHIEGIFEMSVKQDWSYMENPADVLNFTDGLFQGKIRP